MKKNRTKKLFALLAAVCLAAGLLPCTALAAADTDGAGELAEEAEQPAPAEPVCACETDDPAVHRTDCPAYTAPETPECFCEARCGGEEPNLWCDVCGLDYAACTGEAAAALFAVTEGDSNVFVNGVNLNVDTKYTTDADGALSDSSDENYNVLLTKASDGALTLTLNGAKITGKINATAVTKTTAGIFNDSGNTLEIALIGKNEVTAVYDANNSSFAIQSTSSLSIKNGSETGNGELTATAVNAGDEQEGSYGIFVGSGDLTITGCTVTAITGKAPTYGYAIRFGDNLTIDGGRVFANCYLDDQNTVQPSQKAIVTNGIGCGIFNEHGSGGITIENDAEVYAYGGNASGNTSDGIQTSGPLTIKDSLVHAESFPNGSAVNGNGIRAKGGVTVEEGSLVVANGIDNGIYSEGDIAFTGGAVTALSRNSNGGQAIKADGDNIDIYATRSGVLIYAGDSTENSRLLGENENELPLDEDNLKSYAYIKAGVKCTVSYNGNQGQGSMENVVVLYGDSTVISANGFTRTGYTFTGWNTQSDGKGTGYTAGQSVTLTDDLPLYAQWKEGGHTHNWAEGWSTNSTHHWHACNGSGTCNADNSTPGRAYGAHTYGSWTVTAPATPAAPGSRERTCSACLRTQTQTIPATGIYYTVNLPTGEGYTADAESGYSTSVISGGTFKFKINIADGYKAGEDFAVKANGTALTPGAGGVYTISNITADQTVTVSGVVKLYTVTLSAATGGTASADKTSAAQGETVTLTAAPEDGYEFAGWQVTGGNAALANDKAAATTFTMPAANVTVTAVFEKCEVIVKLHINEDFDDSDIPQQLKDKGLDTVDKIEIELKTKITQKESGVKGTALYDVILMYSTDGGVTWILADETHFPADGKLLVQLPIPDGTDPAKHEYIAAHMFTSDAYGKTPGEVEYPPEVAVARKDGKWYLDFYVTGLSPISVGWTDKPASPAPSSADVLDDVPDAGDDSNMGLWIALAMISLTGLAACIILRRRRRID